MANRTPGAIGLRLLRQIATRPGVQLAQLPRPDKSANNASRLASTSTVKSIQSRRRKAEPRRTPAETGRGSSSMRAKLALKAHKGKDRARRVVDRLPLPH